jgi:hypothetical protein
VYNISPTLSTLKPISPISKLNRKITSATCKYTSSPLNQISLHFAQVDEAACAKAFEAAERIAAFAGN